MRFHPARFSVHFEQPRIFYNNLNFANCVARLHDDKKLQSLERFFSVCPLFTSCAFVLTLLLG